MRKWIAWWLLSLVLPCGAKPVEDPRGLCRFEVPSALPPVGAMRWGSPPGLVLEMREEFAPAGEIKELITSMVPKSQGAKVTQEDEIELEPEGRAQIFTKKESITYSKFLFVRRGRYNLGWSLSSQGPSTEVDTAFAQWVQSLRLSPEAPEDLQQEIHDPSGRLQIRLPAGFSGSGRKFSNGQLLVTLTSLAESNDNTLKNFAYGYAPPHYKVYLRRNRMNFGDKTGALILATSEDGLLESQMAMLRGEQTSAVITFIAPIALRASLQRLREAVLADAHWLR